MTNLSPKERVMARRLLRLMMEMALTEEKNLVEAVAKRLDISLAPKMIEAEERDLIRAGNKRPGRTKGLRRGFAG